MMKLDECDLASRERPTGPRKVIKRTFYQLARVMLVNVTWRQHLTCLFEVHMITESHPYPQSYIHTPPALGRRTQASISGCVSRLPYL